jgi:ABC-type multidrug transport system fused ATPase/permease subunit/glycosyltransferase involved in cell wall biosynthesis
MARIAPQRAGRRGAALSLHSAEIFDTPHGQPSAPGEVRANGTRAPMQRPTVSGKFLWVGDRKLWVRGVTYGTFRPDSEGRLIPSRERVRADFAAMAQCGFNTVRTYTLPPRWLLDTAQEFGLRVMVGLWWDQFVTFLDDRRLRRKIESDVRDAARSLAGHPALLCYALANEIPASVVRWHGRRPVEKFLHRLYRIVKREDPTALVTYVNYPTTEYLRLGFLDLVCFNVYLESEDRLRAYLAKLQNIADDRPLLMAEIGLDSRRHGETQQAETLAWQIRTVFEAGCCGLFVFSWTDEWFCGGFDIEDWDFGITRRDRTPKPALKAVVRAYAQTPFAEDIEWPRVSVVVCSFNGSATIRDTMEGLQKLEYPDYEVIVVNDGSTDQTPEIVAEYPVRLISTENRGLSNARNTGCEAATGEIVAYIDDDAWPDPHWLHYLALEFLRGDYVGVGGPNLPPPGDGAIADCVANAPGGPVQVLLTDRVAEHIPGCNMAFRKSALEAVNGFDPVYRAAGDDVDLCWRLQERGGVIGFAHAAIDWHHRRNSVRTYWKQQRGYGKAEALLERKWPQRYNAAGHVAWHGRLYGQGFTLSLASLGGRVYRGVWGSAPFQSLYERRPPTLLELSLMPEWYLLVAVLATSLLLAFAWTPLLWVAPLLGLATGLPIAQAVNSATRARFSGRPNFLRRCGLVTLTACLHLQQPLARLIGRLQHGLTPWRRRGRSRGEFDDWDLGVRGGLFGAGRLRMVIEEHGAGKQMLRFRLWPTIPAGVFGLITGLCGLSILAVLQSGWIAGSVFAFVALCCAATAAADAARAMAALRDSLPAAKSEGALIVPFPTPSQEAPEPPGSETEPSLQKSGTRHRNAVDLVLYRRLLRHARPYWGRILGLFLLSLLSTPLALLTPLPVKVVVDSVIGTDPLPTFLVVLLPDMVLGSRESILVLAVVLVVAVALLKQVQHLASSVLRASTAENLVRAFRAHLFRHVQRLSPTYHDSKGTADAAYRIQKDADSIHYVTIDGVIPFVTSAFTLLSMVYVVVRLDWQLSLVALAVSPALFVLTRHYRINLRRRSRTARRLEGQAIGIVYEVLSALRVVKAFGQEERELARFESAAQKGVLERVRLAASQGGLGLLVGVTTAAGTAAILLLGTRHVLSGELLLGELLLIMSYLTQLYEPMRTISKKVASLQGHLASAERAFALLDETPDVPEKEGARCLERARGHVAFDGVSFEYEPGTRVVQGASFEINSGMRVGIVGRTGTGKTTILHLLTRFFDPTQGRILLDGVDLRDYRLRDLRRQFAIVLQEPVLFSTSIAENIAYGRPDAERSEIVAAATAANAHEFIAALRDGYDTAVGERGMRLSGGERQRIALARAFLKDAPILILDEPTSSVDVRTEAGIMEALERLMEKRTTFMVAHRLGTLESCELLLRIDDGGSVRSTSHAELAAQNPVVELHAPEEDSHPLDTGTDAG